MTKWICSQFGAREKYAIPRALQLRGLLKDLYTDIWLKETSPLQAINKRAKGRYNTELKNATVHHYTNYFLFLKIKERLLRRQVEYDVVFDDLLSRDLKKCKDERINFFGYSYSSRKSFKIAKQKGYNTFLGQINPGPKEAEIVIEEYKKFRGGVFKPFVPSKRYWDLWREEISLSDKLIVNSEWSKKLLLEEGISPDKLVVIPLAYEPTAVKVERTFKNVFSKKEPLELLYLGGIGIRKGFHILVDALRDLLPLPVHLNVVGELKGPKELLTNLPANITYHGSVAQQEVSNFYRTSDLFMFPTLSDGFGLTQLEAQAYKLPIVTSMFCAPVISDRRNGIVLQKVDKTSLKEVIQEVLDTPKILEDFSNHSLSLKDFSINRLADSLSSLK
ncbi:glycosyltransferase family 4 protein [Chryseosolibacter indicus]|uniref:Glycosyltransferase family 4 protein n=1 Tax=Chryseosolibacter indicus TaxID=2782351 RepID=A0ABS5VU03_9BACT|nr:glycosyltransferase family 4 protein [Chryseosolibacter indicus]MBT1704898.1 glycosyltransferase family 4 protein [Chryseosolibacter indicus]